jgi:hypothetical protein
MQTPESKTSVTSYTLSTGGGKIRCRRCVAKSVHTNEQCGRPALKTSSTQKCQYHGGRSTGPRTAEGKARIAALHTVHGEETRAKREERSAASARLSQLEDAAHLLGMMTGPRCRGRKASGYVPIKTLDDVRRMLLDDSPYLDRGVSRRRGKI